MASRLGSPTIQRRTGDGRTEIFSIGTDGLAETQLTFDGVRNRFPAWGRGHQ